MVVSVHVSGWRWCVAEASVHSFSDSMTAVTIKFEPQHHHQVSIVPATSPNKSSRRLPEGDEDSESCDHACDLPCHDLPLNCQRSERTEGCCKMGTHCECDEYQRSRKRVRELISSIGSDPIRKRKATYVPLAQPALVRKRKQLIVLADPTSSPADTFCV